MAGLRSSLAALVAIACLWNVRSLRAHEGHEPLPTKGAQVDVGKGLITLSPEAQQALGVQTVVVEYKPAEEKTMAYATLVTPWQQHRFVSSRIAGKIVKLHVQTGQRITAGQVLAEVASPELETVELELLNALNEVELSTKNLQRATQLVNDQVIPGRDLIETQTKHRQHQNAVEIARSKLRSLGFDDDAVGRLEKTAREDELLPLPIVSPIEGTVSHTDFAVGKVVIPNEHLFEVVDLSQLWVRIGVLEKDVTRVVAGQPLELKLTAYPREVFRTTVDVATIAIDPETHLGTVWAGLKNEREGEPRFLPGMHGLARVVVSKAEKLLTIPASALVNNGTDRYVLVEAAATAKAFEYRKQNVVVASQTTTQVQIRGGSLYPGDRVVTAGSHVLSAFFVQGVLRLSPEAIRNIGLRIEPVQKHAVEDVLEFDGTLDLPPDHRAIVSSQLSGTLHSVLVERGQRVSAGDVIAEVASLELQDIQLEMLRSHLEAESLQQLVQLLKPLDQSQVIARRRVWETETQYRTALNRRDSAQRRLIAMGVSREQISAILNDKALVVALPVRAPITGAVVHFDTVLGQAIPADEPLFEIHDVSRPWVQAFLSERESAQVPVGTPVRIRLAADPAFLASGKVVRSARTFGDENRTLSVWIELIEPQGVTLRQNMLARVSATLNTAAPAIAVPRAAIVREGTRNYVFIQQDDGTLDRRAIETGRADDRFVQITRGLKLQEKIAVHGSAELQTAYASLR